jgi:hypothetical protein
VNDDDETENWADSPGALDFLGDLRRKRKAQLDSLLGAAKTSNDPSVRANSYAVEQLDNIIKALEDERGKSD